MIPVRKYATRPGSLAWLKENTGLHTIESVVWGDDNGDAYVTFRLRDPDRTELLSVQLDEDGDMRVTDPEAARGDHMQRTGCAAPYLSLAAVEYLLEEADRIEIAKKYLEDDLG